MGLYEKKFTRDFCLGLIQVWNRAEGLDFRKWISSKPEPPHIVHQRKDGVVICYLHDKGVENIQKNIRKSLPDTKSLVMKEFSSSFEKIKDVVNDEEVLELDELKDFTEQLREVWNWFDGVWWTITVLEEERKNASDILELRKKGEHLVPGADAVIKKTIINAYPDYEEYVDVITLEEALRGKLPALKELEKRLKGYFYLSDALEVGKDRDFVEEKYGIRFHRERVEGNLQGQIAYRGKAKGKVRKVMGRKDVPKLKEGEILVAPSTTPDFMPALKKCSGIIGDEGGLLSHTSIVARELKKPCIIGTKYATETLEDGEFVEVNADEGVVRRIK